MNLCPLIATPLWGDWATVPDAFAGAAALHMGQAWRENPGSGFREGEVRFGHNGADLLVWASLQDEDIFTDAHQDHEPLWMLGDTLELFVQPPGQEAYYELHVGPGNQLLQLKWPDEEYIQRLRLTDPGEWRSSRVMERPLMRTLTLVEEQEQRWQALISIPVAGLLDATLPTHRREWRVSFSRYDYTRGKETPEHSSTSPHARLDFHRLTDWGSYVLETAPDLAG